MPPSVLNPLCTYEQVHMVPVHSVPRVYREGQGPHQQGLTDDTLQLTLRRAVLNDFRGHPTGI